MSIRTKFAAAGLVAAALPVAVATAGSAETSPSTSASPPSASATASPSSTTTSSAASATTSSAASGATTPRVEKPIALRLAGKGLDEASMPDANEVFTRSELAAIVPHLTGVTLTDDTTLDLTIAGEPSDDRSRLVVDLPHAGPWADVEAAWKRDKALHEKRAAANPGLYTFFGNGAHGVSDSFTDGTTTYALVRTGGAAAVIRFSGIGFTTLAGSHADARRDYTMKTVPALVDLLGAKTRAGEQVKSKSSASSSASSGAQSAAPSSSSAS